MLIGKVDIFLYGYRKLPLPMNKILEVNIYTITIPLNLQVDDLYV